MDFLLEQEASTDSEEVAGLSTEGQQVSIRGNLEQMQLGDIFQTLSMSKLEGTLRVRTPVEQREVLFRDGLVRCYTPIRAETRRIGQRLVREGLLSAEQLRPALLVSREKRQPLGQVLIEQGLVAAEVIESLLRKQCADDLYALFTWKHGNFEFYKGQSLDPHVRQQLAHLPAFEANAVMLEVARRSDEWERIDEALSSTDEVFARSVEETPQGLDEDTALLFGAVNGQMTVRELADYTMLGLFECARAMLALFEGRAVESISIEKLIGIGQAHLERGDPKRALVTVQTAHDRPEVEQSQPVVASMVAILRKCGEPKLAASYLLEAALRATKHKDVLALTREARELDPHSLPILEHLRTALMQGGEPADAETADEFVEVLGNLADAYAEAGDVEAALGCVESIAGLEPGNQQNSMRKARLLHKQGKVQEAVGTLLELATLLKSQKRQDRLAQVYEQILKIDYKRRDIARALKALHAGRGLRILRYAAIAATVAILAGAGVLLHGHALTNEQIESVLQQANELLASDQPEQALRVLEECEHNIARQPKVEELRTKTKGLVAQREQKRSDVRRRSQESRLAAAADYLEHGERRPALALYADLVKQTRDSDALEQVVATRITGLVPRLEVLSRSLPFLVPPRPNVLQNEAQRTQVLKDLSANFKETDDLIAAGVLKAERDPLLERWLNNEQRSRLINAARTVADSFKSAKERKKEYAEAQARVDAAKRLEPILLAARDHEARFEFAKALEQYRKLVDQHVTDDDSKKFFRDQVERYASIQRFLSVIEKATRENDFMTAVGQLRALRRAHSNIPFDQLVELPLRVESLPTGASVRKDGVEVGKTPAQITYTPAKETKIRVDLEGFAPEEVVIKGDGVGLVRSPLAKTPAWTMPVNGVVERAPSIDGRGRHAFVVDRSGGVTALDLATRTQVWAHHCPDLSGLLTAPALGGDRLVFGSADGPLRCLDAATGAPVWEVPDLPAEAAPLLIGELALIATSKGQLVAVRFKDGTVVWRRPLPGPVRVNPVAAGKLLLLATTNGHLLGLRRDDGSEQWKAKVADSGLTSPLVTKAGIVVAAEEGSLTAFALEDGRRLWRQTDLGELTLQPVATSTHVLVAEGKSLTAFALATGEKGAAFTGDLLWSTDPALFGSQIVIGSRAGPILVIDAVQMLVRYRLRMAKATLAPALILDSGDAIVGSSDKAVVCYHLLQ